MDLFLPEWGFLHSYSFILSILKSIKSMTVLALRLVCKTGSYLSNAVFNLGRSNTSYIFPIVLLYWNIL